MSTCRFGRPGRIRTCAADISSRPVLETGAFDHSSHGPAERSTRQRKENRPPVREAGGSSPERALRTRQWDPPSFDQLLQDQRAARPTRPKTSVPRARVRGVIAIIEVRSLIWFDRCCCRGPIISRLAGSVKPCLWTCVLWAVDLDGTPAPATLVIRQACGVQA